MPYPQRGPLPGRSCLCSSTLWDAASSLVGCLQELQERLWSSLMCQQKIFMEGSSEVVVIHGQNILICLNSSKHLPLPQDRFGGVVV